MVSDIILRNLATPPVKGTSAPLISTKVGQRDGTRAGGGGGGGGLYDINSMTYLGSFAIRSATGEGSFNFARGCIGFHPPHGGNGTYGSIFMDGKATGNGGKVLAEFQIPETLGSTSETNPTNLPAPTQLQDYILLANTAMGDTSNDGIGWMRVIDGRLMMFTYTGYGSDTNNQSLGYLNDPTDLANSTGYGWGQVEKVYSGGQDYGYAWINPIPAEYQSILGGNTWAMGSGNGASIVGRLSQGPSLISIKPEDYVSGTMSQIFHQVYTLGNELGRGTVPAQPADAKLNNGSNFPDWDQYNQTASIHYLSFFGDTGPTYYLSPPTTDPTWQVYKDWFETANRTEWSTLPPPPGPLNDLWLAELSSACTGFIVPGTKTFLALGELRGAKFGGGYKMPAFDASSFSVGSGPQELSDDDFNMYYWAFNMDDIVAAANPWDVLPYSYGVWPQAPKWLYRTTNRIARSYSGFFDPATSRVYTSRREVSYLSGVYQTVIDVFSV